MSKKKINLIWKILIAIALGVILGFVMPAWSIKIFSTINGIFSNLLGFIIPLLILGLVAPGIADLGKGSGRMLGQTAGIAYGSTLITGFTTYAICAWIFSILLNGGDGFNNVVFDNSDTFGSYFNVDMPPVMGVTTALILAFTLGLGSAYSGSTIIKGGLMEFRDIIMLIIKKIIIPFLPIYIFGIFLKMVADGQIMVIGSLFLKVVIVIFVLHILVILAQYVVAGIITKRNPFSLIKVMLPAYITALGTQSSAATIPVTLASSIKNGVKEDIADFVIPLCATIHLSSSMLKVVSCAMAIMIMNGMDINIALMSSFILSLSITVVAAPGVPGGVIMASLGLLTSILGFTEPMNGIMIALYIAMDGFGTAGNVIGDGAIALIVDKLNNDKKN